MRIYAVADIHGRVDRFELVRKKAVETEADLIVMAGDISGFFFNRWIPGQLTSMPVPVFYVRGNSDRRATDRYFQHDSSVTHLHLKKVHYRGECFSGISGVFLLPFESRLCLAEKRLLTRLDTFFSDVSVLVTHPPPRGTLDRVMGRFHSGSRALRELARKYQPSLLICGHIHEETGATFLGRTLVVNCSMARKGAGVMVDCHNGALPRATIL